MKKNENRIPGTEPITSLIYLLRGERDSLEQALFDAEEATYINRLLGAIHLVEAMMDLSYFTNMEYRGYDIYRLVKQLKMDISYERTLIKRANFSLKDEKDALKEVKGTIITLRKRYANCDYDFEEKELREAIAVQKDEMLPRAEVRVASVESLIRDCWNRLEAMKALQAYLQDTKYFARLYEQKE